MKEQLERLQQLLELSKFEKPERLEIIQIITLLKGYSELVDKFNDMAGDCDRHIKTINEIISGLTAPVEEIQT